MDKAFTLIKSYLEGGQLRTSVENHNKN